METPPHPAAGWDAFDMSKPARLLLHVLWRFADLSKPDPVVYPSQALLAVGMGTKTRMVRKTIGELEKLGAVTVQRGGPRSNRYHLHAAPAGSWVRVCEMRDALSSEDRHPQCHSKTGTPGATLEKTGTPSASLDRHSQCQKTGTPSAYEPPRTTMEPPDHREGSPEQFALIPPEAEVDTVRELWNLQERYRREINPKARGLELTTGRRRRVAARLKSHGLEACRHVLDVRRAECMANPESARWFNGVTNWRPDPFDLALSMSVEAAAAPKVRRLHHQHHEDRRWKTTTKKASEND